MKTLYIVIALLVLVPLAYLVATRGAILNRGVPLSGVSFSSDKISGVPVYPGATQITSSQGVTIPDDMRRALGNNIQWNRYQTSDSKDTVLQWYTSEIIKAGFAIPTAREGDWLLWTTANRRYGLFVTGSSSLDIVLGSGTE